MEDTIKIDNESWQRQAEWSMINWNHYRIQAAIAAMQGMLANPKHHDAQVESGVPFSNFYAINAVMCADALIAELKKGGNNEE